MSAKRIDYPLLQEAALVHTLPSGLTVIALPRSGYQRNYAVFMSKYGSNDNVFVVPGYNRRIEVPDGIAHFLEHQLFAMEDGSADLKFAEWGASSNAFTSWTRTAYLFSTTDNLFECLRLLVDFVQHPYFTTEGTEKEKGIIEQEIHMYEDDPDWRVHHNLLQALFHNHPVRLDIAGTVESTRKISRQLLEDCYRTFYHPANMVLVVAGDFHPHEVIQTVEEQLSQLEHLPQGEIQRIYPQEPAGVNQPRVTERLAVSNPLFALGFKDARVGWHGEALLRRQVMTEVVLQVAIGKSSDLYNQLYADGLIDEDFASGYTSYPDHGYSMLHGESKDPAQLYERLLHGLEDLRCRGIAADELERARRVLYGDYLQHFNSLESVANQVADGFFDGFDYLTYLNVLTSLTLDEVNQRMREHLDQAQAAFSEVLPLDQ